MSLADLEQVELLRGPQGALYGRNASAWAIVFDTRKPSQAFSAEARAGIGNYGRRMASGHVNAPLGDTVALRVRPRRLPDGRRATRKWLAADP